MKTFDDDKHHGAHAMKAPSAKIEQLTLAPMRVTNTTVAKIIILGFFIALAGYTTIGHSHAQNPTAKSAKSDGPANQGNRVAPQTGNARSGQDVFRSETFGNEGFWTNAARVPQGVVAARVTPLKAMQLGLSVNVDALDAATRKAVAAELKKDPTGRTSMLLNDPATTVKLVNANAVIGLAAKDSNGDGVIDVAGGDRVGVS